MPLALTPQQRRSPADTSSAAAPVPVRAMLTLSAPTTTGPSLLAVVTADGTTSHIRVAGELDIATADLFDGVITRQIAAGHLDVQLDLSELSFCDTSGLRAVLRGSRRLAAAGGQLILHHPTPSLVRVAELAGWASDLSLAGDSPAANSPAADGWACANCATANAPQRRRCTDCGTSRL